MQPIEIDVGLWQGDENSPPAYQSQDGSSYEFDAIATIDPDIALLELPVEQMLLDLLDTAINRNQISAILNTADWVYENWQSGKQVLVRCQAGMNRSGLIIAIALMKDGASASEAITTIRAKNPAALSNSAFVEFLENI